MYIFYYSLNTLSADLHHPSGTVQGEYWGTIAIYCNKIDFFYDEITYNILISFCQ